VPYASKPGGASYLGAGRYMKFFFRKSAKNRAGLSPETKDRRFFVSQIRYALFTLSLTPFTFAGHRVGIMLLLLRLERTCLSVPFGAVYIKVYSLSAMHPS